MMNERDKTELWARLKDFDLDDPESKLRFSDRLARENGWTEAYTLRVLEEYKRFIYLCRVAGHPVTPSDEVDQAWHLHLCYTRSYWDEMCGEILGAPVHHGPTRGGKSEGEKFVDWYGKTLQAYRDHFCAEPPADIWPASRERFAAREFRRVDASRLFLLPRKRVYAGALAAAAALVLASCSPALFLANIEDDIFFFFCLGVIAIAVLMSYKGRGGKGGGGCGGGCGGGGGGGWFGGDGCSSDSGCGGGGCGGGCGS